MKIWSLLFWSCASLAAQSLPCHGNSYVLSTFQGSLQQLLLEFSPDGVNFGCSATVSYAPQVRDPSIMFYSGKWWVAHTNAGAVGCTQDNGFSVTSSSDLQTWANPICVIPAVSGSALAWAPEWFIDTDGSVHIVVAVSTEGCSFGSSNMQIYEMHPTAADFSTWSNPVLLTVSGMTDIIDPFMVKVGSTYYLWFKQSCSTGDIGYASSSSLTGAYTLVQSGNWAGWGPAEGPALYFLGGSSWRLYWDICSGGACSGVLGQLYHTESTDNWVTWSAPVALNTPGQAKQGTVISYAPGLTGGSVLRGQGTLRGNVVMH